MEQMKKMCSSFVLSVNCHRAAWKEISWKRRNDTSQNKNAHTVLIKPKHHRLSRSNSLLISIFSHSLTSFCFAHFVSHFFSLRSFFGSFSHHEFISTCVIWWLFIPDKFMKLLSLERKIWKFYNQFIQSNGFNGKINKFRSNAVQHFAFSKMSYSFCFIVIS